MSEWTSVKEAFPLEGKRVLVGGFVSNSGGGYLGNRYIISIEELTYPKDGNLWSCRPKESIEHWMFLPNPPKEENQEYIPIHDYIVHTGKRK